MDDIINKMKEYLTTSENFQDYVAKNMDTYDRTLDQELQSPITQNYYKSLQKGGCNYREEAPK